MLVTHTGLEMVAQRIPDMPADLALRLIVTWPSSPISSAMASPVRSAVADQGDVSRVRSLFRNSAKGQKDPQPQARWHQPPVIRGLLH